MPKTAQEWQDLLGLDKSPDAAFLADLNAVEGLEVSDGTLPPERFVEMTPLEIAAAVYAETPITTDEQCFRATKVLMALDREIGETPGHPLAPLADRLMRPILAYDELHFPPAAPDMELRLLMKEHGVTEHDLAVATGIGEGQIGKLASGEQAFTADHAHALGYHFDVDPSLFLDIASQGLWQVVGVG